MLIKFSFGFLVFTSQVTWKNSAAGMAYLQRIYRMILSVLDPRKCEYLKDYSLDFEHASMTTYIAS